jgi:uncharacterized membrane protein YoaK (UPF0700 family)
LTGNVFSPRRLEADELITNAVTIREVTAGQFLRGEGDTVRLSEVKTRVQNRLAAILAFLAGYIDSYALLNYKVYASFMSGNTTQTGLRAGQGDLAEAGRNLLPILLFVIGIFIGTFVLHSNLRNQLGRLWAMVGTLLATSFVAAYGNSLVNCLGIIPLSLAMGVMNTTITRVGGQSVSIGFVTGDLERLKK